ncbi:histidine kinase [Aquimarina sp. AD10]|uniref:Histidine kinase n=1 Tax=Aquimarina aggregata TaxID=1642818 RepID=A0A162XSM3_9FLAO|nr:MULTISPECIES: 2TM domain-containing protein [Aquimarina]AXT60309.1 histidine kinase [Aquimarina sp. AD10]KZS38746.1 histidine kinase [Aquimarina aggregata]RKN01256.1 histidine kinase [Aquimarina sp. AD10]
MNVGILKLAKISIIIAIIIDLVFILFRIGTPITWLGELENLSIHFMFSFALTSVNGYFFYFLDRWYTWEKHPKKKLWYGAIGSIILTMITLAIVRLLLIVGIYGKPFNKFIKDEKLDFYIIGFVITLVASLFFHAFYFFKELQKQKITEQKIIAGTASAKFAALKNQLDPHFLFNSLNVLTSLIEENPRMAQKFTTSLSKVYRYVLEQKDKELVTVDEELKFARTYMTLIQLRFEDSIVFDIPDKATNADAKVVPLSLQILLENTVKHNVVMPERPLHIKIYEKDNFLVVENNLQPKEVIKQSSGVGLGNVMQRYALLTKRKFSVYKTEDAFIAELPILTKKIKFADMQVSQTIQDIEMAKSLKYERAKEQVKKMKEFYGNLIAFCIVIPFLAFLNYYTTSFRFPWVLFPIAGWGIGLVFHYAEAYDRHPIFGKDWEKRKIKKYMDESKNFYNE